MPVTRSEFTVAGAGIGGLATALALARLGHRVLVVEREAGPHETGNGLQLAPNAMRVLAHLGLPAPRPRYGRPEALELRSAATARLLGRIPLGKAVDRRHHAPYCTVARADLHRDLAAAATDAGAEIRYGAGLEDVRVTADGAQAHLADGGTALSHGLIGADGLWSKTRGLTAPKAQPRHVGDIAWRGIAPMAAVPAELAAERVVAWLGAGIHAVLYPIEEGQRLNLVVVSEGHWTGQGWQEPADAAELARLAGGMAPPLAGAIAAAQDWRRWPLFETRPAITAGSGPVTLVGDAAHPMLPYLAQGASMAIEDAFALAEAVSAAPDDAPAAFRRFERARAGRLSRVIAASRRNGWVFHLMGPARLARNLVLGSLPETLLLTKYDWLWGGGPIPARAVR